MRILEVLITILCLFNIILLIRRSATDQRLTQWALLGMTVLLVFAHLFWEGYRWQMIPLYVIVFGVVSYAIVLKGEIRRAWTISGAITGSILLVLGTAALILLPVPRMPEPVGPYQIGTVTFHWVDQSRIETYGGADGSEPRELMAQVWYPAEPDRAPVRKGG